MSLKFTVKLGRLSGVINTCEWCKYSTRSQHLFEKHLNRCKPPPTIEAPAAAAVGKNKKNGKPKHSCFRCEFIADKGRELLLHQADVHGEKVYTCNKCDYLSRFNSKLKQHQATKHGQYWSNLADAGSPTEPDIIVDNISENESEANDDQVPPSNTKTIQQTNDQIKMNLAEILSDGSDSLPAFPILSSQKNSMNAEKNTGQFVSEPKTFKAKKTCGNKKANKSRSKQPLSSSLSSKIPETISKIPEAISKIPEATLDVPDDMKRFYEQIIVTETENDNEIALNKFQCEMCPFSTKHNEKIIRHLYLRHIQKHLIVKTESDESFVDDAVLYQCQLCSFRDGSKENVGCHFFQCHSDSVSVEPVPLRKKEETHEEELSMPVSSTPKVYSCTDCLYTSTHPSNFKVHRSHHVLDGPFKCDRCSYSSFQESAISRHLSMGFHDPDFLTTPSEKKKRKSKPKFTPSKSVLGKSVSPITASSPISRGAMAFLEKSVSGFTCHLCDIPFLTLRKLSRHIAASHEGERAWKCLICGTTYLSRKLLRVHVRMKHERQVTSPNCGSSNISSPKVSPRPKVSSKVYTKLSTKKQRLSTESTPEGLLFPPKSKNLFRCYSCSFKTDSSRNLHKHLYELHHSLDIEKKIENVVSSIANHCKKEYPCPLCNLVSKRKLHLAVHLRAHAKGRSNNTNCPWITAAKESTSNAQIDTSAQSESEFGSNLGKLYKKLGTSSKDKAKVKKTLHRCVYCRKSFMSKKGLNGHITRKHKNSKLFRCMYCVFASPKNYAVKRHIANRHPEKAVLANSFDGIIKLNSPSNFDSAPSAAQNADKSNSSLNKMKETELSISNESVIGALGIDNSGVDSGLTDRPPFSGRKKYACDLCNYSSDCSNKLSCHKEIHTNYRRYKCPVCDRRSNWMVQIRYHIEKVHRDKNLSVRVLSDEEAQALDNLAKDSQNDNKTSSKLNEDSKSKPATEKNSFDDSDSTKQQKLKKVLKTTKRKKKSMETTEEWHGCSKCEYKSLYRWNIVKHIGSVHPGSKIISIKSETMGFQRFRCNVCGLRSNLLSALKSHAVRWHKHAKIEDLKSKQNAKPAKEESISQPVLDSSLGRSSVTGNEMELDEYDRTIESVAGGIGLIEDDADKKVNPSSIQSSDPSVESVKITADKQTASDGPTKKFACSKCRCISVHRTSIHRHLRTVHSDGHKYEILTVTDEDIAKWDAEKFVYNSIDGNASTADGKDAGEADSTESAVLNDSGNQKSKKVLKIHKIQKNVLKIFHKRQFNSSLHGNLSGAVKKNRIHVFKCTLCPLVTYNQYLFTKHKKNHVKRSDSKAECPYCPYFANSTSSIERHLIVHTDEYTSMLSTTSTAVASDIPKDFPVPARPESTSRARGCFACDECPYRANRDRDLLIHKQKHISRPHADLKCGYCTYAVRPQEKHHFQRHVRLHGKTAQIPSTPTKDYDPPASEVDLDTSNDFIDSAKLKHDLVAAKTTFVQRASDQKAEMSLDVFQDKGTGVRRQNSFTEMWLNSSLNVPTEQDKIDRNGEDWKALDDSSSVNCDAESSQKMRIKDFPSVDSDWHCERCPYAGNSLVQFNNHISLHNSKQKYECEFCDYSVSRYCHLLQHRRLHLTKKNPNLLSAQTVTSLQQLPQAETIVERQVDDAVNYGSLFENSSAFTAPIKLFRCVHCPFSSSHRMNFVKHLKGHQISSQHRCPYCTYSVSDKQQLIPHIRDHFNLPGSEMNAYTDYPAENSMFVSEFMKAILEKIGILSKSTEDGSDDVKPETNDEASKETASSFKSESSVKLAHPVISEALNSAANFEIKPPEVDIESKNNMGTMEFVSKIMESVGGASNSSDTANIGGVKPPSASGESSKSGPFICQYCDRYCNSASHLVAHESAHLIGCGYLQMRHV